MYAIQLENITKIFNLLHQYNGNSRKKITDIFGIKKYYKKLYALRNITFNIRKGEVIGLVGPNGSGKSTLLRIIGNIIQPTSGNLQINGTIANFLELDLGFNKYLTAKQNVYLSGILLGIPRRVITNNLDEIFAFAELEKFIDVPLRQFSHGMLTRLGFGVALLQKEKDIFLFDESLSAGDIDFKKKCFNEINDLILSGKTLIVTSHTLSEVMKICPKTILLNNGRIIYYGKTKDTIKKYKTIINE